MEDREYLVPVWGKGRGNMESIKLREEDLPKWWKEKLVAKQKIGGVVLVFLDGKNKAELKRKTKDIKKLVREYKKQYLTQKEKGDKDEDN